jgi:hypothetical protein
MMNIQAMINSQPPEPEIRQFLLGGLRDAESDIMTLRLLTEDTLLEQVEMCEDELIDEYVEGSLSPPDRQRFEEVFLKSPARVHKLEAARALREALPRMRPMDLFDAPAAAVPRVRPRPFFSLGFGAVAAAALLALSLGAYLFYEMSQLNQTIASLTSNYARASSSLPREAALVTFALSPIQVTRGAPAQIPKIQLANREENILLQLSIPPYVPPGPFTVVISVPGNVQVWSQTRLSADHGIVAIHLPAAAIPPGDYEASLSPANAERKNVSFPFRVLSADR